MASLANPYFPKGNPSEQAIYQGLTTEAIQVVGHTMYYLPRKLQRLDIIFGEDVLSKFDLAIPLEMYISNFQMWEGNQELISKFGLEIQRQVRLVISRERWETEIEPYKNDVWVSARPQEGDLIFEPMSKSLLEIKFADHDEEFWQLAQNYKYTLTCELFRYNNDKISTGVPVIDELTMGMTEDINGVIHNIPENNNIRQDNAQQFTNESTILEFNINNPFGDT